jgi:hypothetical protein
MDQTCYNALLYLTLAKGHTESRDVFKVIERKFGKIETAFLKTFSTLFYIFACINTEVINLLLNILDQKLRFFQRF